MTSPQRIQELKKEGCQCLLRDNGYDRYGKLIRFFLFFFFATSSNITAAAPATCINR